MEKYLVSFYLDANSITAEVVVEASSPEEAEELGRDKVCETYDGSTFMGSRFDITLGEVQKADDDAEDCGESLLTQLKAVAAKNQDIINEYNRAGEEDDWINQEYEDQMSSENNDAKQEMLLAVISMIENGGIDPRLFEVEELIYGE